ncbi:MAG: sulfur oxidation c-type cytochrome SoxX [Rhodospirillaceae bacterium]
MKWAAVAFPMTWLLAASPPAAGLSAAAALVPFEVAGDAVERPLGGLKGNAERGRGIVADRRGGNCLICHAVPSIAEPFQGRIGPSLAGVAKRLTAGQMRLRLIDQSQLNPKTLMPPYYRTENLNDVAPEYVGKPILEAQEIEDVLAFLATLQERK